jgi:hypothetical protein
MSELYAAGATLAEIGAAYGLSRERVRQILRNAGVPARPISQTAEIRRARQLEQARETVTAMYAETYDARLVAQRLKIPISVVQEIVKERFPKGSVRRRHKSISKKYSSNELIAFLKMASAELGGVLTTGAYDQFAQRRKTSDGRPWPTHQTHHKRFGSWRRALHAAGLSANKPSAIAGQILFGCGHCVDAVRALTRQLGRTPTANEYDAFARASKGAMPSLATLRTRCGTWSDALEMAGL